MRRREFVTLLGGLAAWPYVARAQPSAMPVIGFLSSRSPAESGNIVVGFRRGLNELGYVETQNVAIEYRFTEGDYRQLQALAADLVRRQVTVIVASAISAALAAKTATSTIPIVFMSGDDPIRAGVVASLNRPGGNLTGVSINAGPLPSKRLELLREVVPDAKTIGMLVNPENGNAERDVGILLEAVRGTPLQILVARAAADKDLEAAFRSFVDQRATAIIVNTDAFLTSRRNQIVGLAAHHGLPAIYSWREYCLAGGLMSYGANLVEAYHQVGVYAGRVLKGARPADLPVMQPTKFELVINLKTAKALGLTISETFLARADEVIE